MYCSLASQQALRRAVRDTMDMLTGTNFPVMCRGGTGGPEFEPWPGTVADLPIPSAPVLLKLKYILFNIATLDLNPQLAGFTTN